MKPIKVYLSIREYAKRQNAYTFNGLRNLRAHCKTNGFARAFIKVGRKVLIDVDEFCECINCQKEK